MTWKEEYESLTRFISQNPEIVISANEISIPQNLREEFYALFDKIRVSLVETHYSALPVDVDALCNHYLQIEKEVIALLGIEKISMPVDLFAFLHTPKQGLARAIYNRLFDLLQGKITEDVFEEQCVAELKTSSANLFRLGYEWWAGLVVIKLLEPDEVFFVDLDSDYKPYLTELKEISFGRQAHHPTIRIPEFVLHSQKLGRYVAVKMAIAGELEEYAVRLKPAVRPRKRTGDTSFALDSRVMLVSFMASPEDIPIVADIYERVLTRPDWMVECISKDDIANPDALEKVRLHAGSLNPNQGMCLVVMDDDANATLGDLAENIHPVAVGFDQSKLQSVVSSLS